MNLQQAKELIASLEDQVNRLKKLDSFRPLYGCAVALEFIIGPGAQFESYCDQAEHDEDSDCIFCEARKALAAAREAGLLTQYLGPVSGDVEKPTPAPPVRQCLLKHGVWQCNKPEGHTDGHAELNVFGEVRCAWADDPLTDGHLMKWLSSYVSDDDVTLSREEFLRVVRDRILEDEAEGTPLREAASRGEPHAVAIEGFREQRDKAWATVAELQAAHNAELIVRYEERFKAERERDDARDDVERLNWLNQWLLSDLMIAVFGKTIGRDSHGGPRDLRAAVDLARKQGLLETRNST